MEDNRQDIRNKDPYSDDKKQFYSLNLTPERIFLIFILFIIFISILIMIFAFIISSLTKKSVYELENQNEYVFTTNNDIISDTESSKKDDKIESLNITNEDTSNTEVTQEKQIESVNQSDRETNNTGTQTTANSTTKPNLNVKNETIYSSSFIKEEPKNTTLTTNQTKTQTVKPTSTTTSTTRNTTTSTKKTATTSPSTSNTTTQKQSTVTVTKYIIQIAAYSTKKQAEDISQYYNKMGYTTYIRNFTKDNKTYYRLRIGPYDEKKVCEAALKKIKTTTYGKDAFISEGKFQK